MGSSGPEGKYVGMTKGGERERGGSPPHSPHSTRAYSRWREPSARHRHRTAVPVEHGDGACDTDIGAPTRQCERCKQGRDAPRSGVHNSARAGRRSIACSRTVRLGSHGMCPVRKSGRVLREVCAYFWAGAGRLRGHPRLGCRQTNHRFSSACAFRNRATFPVRR